MSAPSAIGFRAGVAAAAATVAYDVVQILQVIGVLHFPVDEILIFGTSLCITVPFLLEVLALHYSRTADKQYWSHAGLLFATMYAMFGAANYVVQLGTVIPAKLQGTRDVVPLLEQTPHSLLWDFDAIAYLAMGLAALLIIPALRDDGAERRVRVACVAHVAATALAGVVYFHGTYSHKLLLLGVPWAITAPVFMLLLALALRTERPAA